MATILFAWELGANLGHLIPIARIAAGLGGDHRLVYAVRDLQHIDAVLEPGVPVVQAPVWPQHRHFGATSGGLASYTDVLTAIGFADPRKLVAMARAWTTLVDTFSPDLVVADHSPGLLLALYGTKVPVVAIGSAFTMPPLDYDHFPRLRGDRAPTIPESRLLAAVREAQEARGARLPANLIEVFRTKGRVVFGLPEIDPYRSFRREPLAAPPGGLPNAQPWPRDRRLFVYAGEDMPNFDTLVQALATIGVPVEAYFRGGLSPAGEFLRMRGATVHETPPDLAEVLARNSHVITQGGAMTAAAVFAAGRPHLVIPPHDEAEVNLAMLQQAGVATPMVVTLDVAEATASIRKFLDDRIMPDRALEQAGRLHGRVLPDGTATAAAAIRAALG